MLSVYFFTQDDQLIKLNDTLFSLSIGKEISPIFKEKATLLIFR